jgi:hypothetical protein
MWGPTPSMPSRVDPSTRLVPSDGSPIVLWATVLSARTVVAEERTSTRGGHQRTAARAVLVRALDAYVLSLKTRGYPVPYALRDEVRLLRLTSTGSHEG